MNREEDRAAAARIVREIQAGSREAEAEMWQRYARPLLMVLRRLTRGDEQLAEDLRSDTFVVALQKIRANGINEPENLAAWLRGIAKMTAQGDQTTKARRKLDMYDDLDERVLDDTRGPASELNRENVAVIVKMLLDELRQERDREILKGVFLEDKDKEEVCRALGMTEEKDKAIFDNVLYRAKKRFRELVERAQLRQSLRLIS